MDLEHPTILIAADVKFNRTLMKMCLRVHGYQFLEADNGYSVLEQIQTHRVDLVILDLMMPMLDGFGCLVELKAHDRYRRIPIIINSSLDDMASIERALALGCYDYFIKSLPQNELHILLPLKVKNAIGAKRLFDRMSEQKHLLESEIEAAGKYQRFLLPNDIIATGLSVQPSYHPYLAVGGDFFDFIPLSEDRTAFLIADVCGHGVLAAMVAALLKPLFERYILETASPSKTLARLNQDFLRLTDDSKYITAFVAIYDPGRQTLCYANAGHPPPLYLRQVTGAIELLKATGTFLGVFQDDEWASTERSIPVMAYDRLLLVTDGVIEATSPNGTMFGIEGLCHLVQDGAETDLTVMTQQLWQHLQAFADNCFHDDVTFITIDFHHFEVAQITRYAGDPAEVLPVVDNIVAPSGQHVPHRIFMPSKSV